MSVAYTTSRTSSFTVTHAKHISYKVATDLRRMQCFYGEYANGGLSDSWIESYESELILYLKEGYLDWVAYGFLRNRDWIYPTLYYPAYRLEHGQANDDDPGGIRPGADVSGALFHSFLTGSRKWAQLGEEAKREFRKHLPFQRTLGVEPGAAGNWVKDRTYSANGQALDRFSLTRCR